MISDKIDDKIDDNIYCMCVHDQNLLKIND
jgi:hypothetical protein